MGSRIKAKAFREVGFFKRLAPESKLFFRSARASPAASSIGLPPAPSIGASPAPRPSLPPEGHPTRSRHRREPSRAPGQSCAHRRKILLQASIRRLMASAHIFVHACLAQYVRIRTSVMHYVPYMFL
jgi:hypothetical protein